MAVAMLSLLWACWNRVSELPLKINCNLACRRKISLAVPLTARVARAVSLI